MNKLFNQGRFRQRWKSLLRYSTQIGYGSLLLLAVWLAVVVMLSHDYSHAVLGIETNNDQLVRGYEEHVRRSLHSVEEQMLLVKREYERAKVTPAIREIFRRVKSNPLLLQILILDPAGHIVASFQSGPSELNYADRSYFQAHVHADKQQTFISEPLVGRITNQVAVYLSRRLNAPDGGFAGVVVMALDSAYFTNFYQAIDFKHGQFVRVIGLDGIVRASWETDSAMNGVDVSRNLLFKKYLPAAPIGRFYDYAPRIDSYRYVSYRSMPDYPLVVAVGMTSGSALADYYERRDLYVTAAGIASLLIVLFCGIAILSASKQLRNDERWKLVVEGVNDGIWDWDAKTERIYFSDRCKAILGYGSEEVGDTRQEWLTRVLPEDLDRILQAVNDHRQGLMPLYNETHLVRCKDGSYKWVRSRGRVLRDEEGQVVRMIGSLTDIHSEKEASMALRISEQELCDSREKYKTLIEQSFEAVAILDPEKNEIVDINKRFTEWFGYSLPTDAPLTSDRILVDGLEKQGMYYESLRISGFLPAERRSFRHKNESLLFMERAVTLVNHGGAPLVMITYRNIADQLQQEQNQRQDAAIARRIQRAQLACPADSEHLSFSTFYRSSGDISGDLYHMEWKNDGQLLQGYLVDVTGHGLTTALYTSTINILLHEAAELDASLPEQVSWLNRQVARHFETNSFAAAIAFEIDLQMRELRYVGAGITRFWAGMAATNGPVTAPGLYLGIDPQQDYPMQCLPLSVGDSLIFATDGVGQLLVDSVVGWPEDCRQLPSALTSIPEFVECRDDATAICIRIKSLPQLLHGDNWPKVLNLNGFDDYRRLKGEIARVLAEVTGKEHSMQEVAVNEAIANALECRDGQSRSQKAQIKINRLGHRLIVRIKTSRIGFAGNAALKRLRSAPEELFAFGEDASMGRGIPLMLSLSDQMTYNNDGTEVLLAWKLDSQNPAGAGTTSSVDAGSQAGPADLSPKQMGLLLPDCSQEEQNFVNFFNSMDDLVFVLDQHFFLLKTNSAVLRRLGYQEAELTGRDFLLIHPQERREEARAVVEQTVVGAGCQYRIPLLSKAGWQMSAETSISKGQWDGQPAWFAVAKDVSALIQSEKNYRDLVQNANSVITRFNERGEITFFNEYAEKFFGFTQAEILGRNLHGTLIPDTDSNGRDLTSIIADICRNPDLYADNVNENTRRDGSRVWVSWTNKVYENAESGEREILSIGSDVTERRRLEQVLRDGEERYRSLMMQSQDAVVLFDLETLNIVEANPRFEKMTGYTPETTTTLTVLDLFDDTKVNVMRYLDQLHSTGLLNPTVRKIKTSGGRRLLVERTGSLVTVGGRRYQLTTFRDVTEEMERQRRMNKEIALASQVQRALLPAIPSSDLFRIETLFSPYGFVSGDVYHLEWLKQKQVLRGFLLDITGHGLATALQTAAVNVLLHEVMDLPLTMSVSEQLGWLNQRIGRYIDETSFAAAMAFEFDFIQGELHYASAGITDFLFNQQQVSAPGMFLGIAENEQYETHRLAFLPGDSICFMTDGIGDVLTAEGSWTVVHAGQICSLFAEESQSDKLKDDATAICVTVLESKR